MSQIELDVRAASSTGLEPQYAAGLAYLAGPFSGLLILLAERTNQFVRFHAWQAIIGLGGLGFLAVTLLTCAFLGLFISPAVFKALYVLAFIVSAVWPLVWGLCVFKAFRGSVLMLPLVGDIAARRASPR